MLPAVSKDGVVAPEAVVISAKLLQRIGEIPAGFTVDPTKITETRFLE